MLPNLFVEKKKMKHDIDLLPNDRERADIIKRKRECGCGIRPASYEMNSTSVLHDLVIAILRFIFKKQAMYEDLMQIDPADPGSGENFQLLFFLDGQGKERVGVIAQMLLRFSHISAVFISSNIDIPSQSRKLGLFVFLDVQECKILSQKMGLMNPLGGGLYPINYLLVVDSHNIVRHKAPLRFSHCYSAYQKFGLTLTQLEGLVEEYSAFANFQSMKT